MFRILFAILFISFLNVDLPGQKLHPKKPFLVNQEVQVPIYSVEKSALRSQLLADSVNYRFKNGHVATSIHVGVNSDYDGVWLKHGDYSVWSIAIHAAGATNMSTVLSEIELFAGAKLFLYSPGGLQQYGPFTKRDVVNGIVVVPFIEGEIVYVEYQVPENQLLGRIAIESIGYQDTQFFKDGRYGRAGDCNIDINCYSDIVSQQLKQSVMRIYVNGTDYCTGTLLNNTELNGAPYILTANHCIKSAYYASRTKFYFNYESPYCEGPDDSFIQIDAAELMATSENLDFTLVKLFEELDFRFKPYYAGWNATGEYPTFTYTIHHPEGDVKKISQDYDEPGIASFGAGYNDNSHWYIYEWDEGTTEGGSSGGPLFDQYNQVIGDLSGGWATCDDPQKDYYQMFNKSFDEYQDSTEQLKKWLDPLNIGVRTLLGYDPYLLIKLSADTLSNITDNANLVSLNSNQWGYLTGHSNLGATAFAEKYSTSTEKSLLGFNIHVFKAEALSDITEITFKLYSGSNAPGNVIVSKSFSVDYFLSNQLTYLEFDYPIKVVGDFFLGYEIEYAQPSDTFAVYHTVNAVQDNSTWVLNNAGEWVRFNEYNPSGNGASLALNPILFDSILTDTFVVIPETNQSFLVYPNPVITNTSKIVFKEITAVDLYGKIYSVNGKLVREFTVPRRNQIYLLDTYGLTNGVYFVTLFIDGVDAKQKIVIQK